MLAEIRVRDLALLEEVEVTLDPGLNVVSGETGEGKSLLLLALALLLGSRARKGLVRAGCREAVVEGRFRLDAESGARLSRHTDLVPPGAEELCLRRVVAEDGASRAYLDGALCPIGLLQKLGRDLVDLHGQGEAHSLFRPAERAAVLDRFGGQEEAARRFAADLRSLREAGDALRRLAEAAGQREDRLEFLRFQGRELEAARPAEGEEPALEAEIRVLSQAEELSAHLDRAAAALAEDDGAVGETCARLARGLEGFAAGDSELEDAGRRLRALQGEAEDLGRACSRLARRITADPARLRAAEARLDLLRALARRHRCEVGELPARAAALRSEIEALESAGATSGDLEARRSALRAGLRALAGEILDGRRRAARKLERAIREGLAELRLEKAGFRIVVEPAGVEAAWDPEACSESGPGAVDFLVAVNPGEPEQPFERVASGGETARILLALKGALAGMHRIPLLVLDEIDSGIGGRVGLPFGRRIAAIARHHQVLVVTHLPQVAAFAGRHLRVRKRVVRGRTRTEVEVLDRPARVEELAEMLGGAGQDAARAQAAALLQEAGA